MLRKTLLALASAAALGIAAFAPTTASAHHFGGFPHSHGHWGPGFGIGFYGTDDADDGECYLVRQPTKHGYRLVNVCD